VEVRAQGKRQDMCAQVSRERERVCVRVCLCVCVFASTCLNYMDKKDRGRDFEIKRCIK